MFTKATHFGLPRSKQTIVPFHRGLLILLGSSIEAIYIKSDGLHDLKPIMFISGKFQTYKYNYAALVQEAFDIHMSVKRLCFYMKEVEHKILVTTNYWKNS